MEVSNFESDLKKGNLNNLYLLYGEEKYLLDLNIKKIKKIFGEIVNGINYIQIDSNNVTQIIENIETPAFGYPKKIIIARNTGLFQKPNKKGKKTSEKSNNIKEKNENKFEEKLATYIDENINIIKQSVVVIFIENEIDKNNLYKTLEKHGIICNFEKQKPQEIIKRLKSICNAYKVNADIETLNYLIECCGTSLQDLINEIRKQIEYVGENGTITKQTIDILSIKQFESVIFELTDNLGKRDIQQSLNVLKNLIYAKEPVQKIFITLYNHFKKLYITKIAIREKMNLSESLKLKPNQTFLTNKYTMQCKYFEEKELKNILEEFINLDYKVKNGKIDINVGLESILCRYCSK